jgi:cytochrome c-type biogenesis protein CcmH/NrfF
MTSIFPSLLLLAIVWALFKLRARKKRWFDSLSPEQQKSERKRRRIKEILWD